MNSEPVPGDSLPKSLRRLFGITGKTKALVHREGDKIIVEPKTNFWSLAGSLKSSVKLSDQELREAREVFSKEWGDADGDS